MPKLRIVSFKTMRNLLLHLGFEEVRQNGSHVIFKHLDGRTTTVPNHAGRDLARPLIRDILRDIGLTVADFDTELQNL